MKICKSHAEGCVERYMDEGGPRCWDRAEIANTCGNFHTKKCDDCGIEFCILSPRRPATARIANKEYKFCPSCIKPYSVHRAHWTWDTYFAKQQRAIDARNHAAMHEFRTLAERGFSHQANDDEVPF